MRRLRAILAVPVYLLAVALGIMAAVLLYAADVIEGAK